MKHKNFLLAFWAIWAVTSVSVVAWGLVTKIV